LTRLELQIAQQLGFLKISMFLLGLYDKPLMFLTEQIFFFNGLLIMFSTCGLLLAFGNACAFGFFFWINVIEACF
jgi:hypothetical protein